MPYEKTQKNPLRTLKDLMLYRPLMEKMLTDLKTHKQLEKETIEMLQNTAIKNDLLFDRQIQPVAIEDLQQVAREWIKELEKFNIKLFEDINLNSDFHTKIRELTHTEQTIQWIKHFFNLGDK